MSALYHFTLIALIGLALFIVLTRQLTLATIVFGTFSALSSLAFLLLAAPDVALAQTIIGCTISTIIFLSGIKRYKRYMRGRVVQDQGEKVRRSLITAVPLILIMGLVFYFAEATNPLNQDTMAHIMNHYMATGAENAVTAVYLDFRILDTLLEAFLLMVSVVGISQFLILEDIEKLHKDEDKTEAPLPTSPFTVAMGRILLVLAAIFGVYTIAFGADSPGGGFQGGAVLAAIVMIWYLTKKEDSFHFHKLSVIEEIAFLLFLGLVGVYFAFYEHMGPYRLVYLILCAVFVGIKVAIGLGVIFLHFAGADEEIE